MLAIAVGVLILIIFGSIIVLEALIVAHVVNLGVTPLGAGPDIEYGSTATVGVIILLFGLGLHFRSPKIRSPKKRIYRQMALNLAEAQRLSVSNDWVTLTGALHSAELAQQSAQALTDGEIIDAAESIQRSVLPRVQQLGYARCEGMVQEGWRLLEGGQFAAARKMAEDAQAVFNISRLWAETAAAANKLLQNTINQLRNDRRIDEGLARIEQDRKKIEEERAAAVVMQALARARQSLQEGRVLLQSGWRERAVIELQQARRDARIAQDLDIERSANELLEKVLMTCPECHGKGTVSRKKDITDLLVRTPKFSNKWTWNPGTGMGYYPEIYQPPVYRTVVMKCLDCSGKGWVYRKDGG